MESVRRSGNFRGVKIALIIFQILSLIGAVILLIILSIALAYADQNHRLNKNEKTTLTVAAVVYVISLVVNIVGLVGSFKENQILTLIYGIAIALSTICHFATQQYWSAVMNLIVTTLAFAFVYLIRKEIAVVNFA